MSYYNSGGGYHRGDYGHRINEEDVPESKHTIFIRGLPGNMTTDEVKEFFETKVGTCSFDFTKVSQDRSRLFVAVRFDSRENAKDCMVRYKDADILGYPCELTWFRDIRRYASYQAAQQGGRPGGAMRGRGRGSYQQRNSFGNRSYDNRGNNYGNYSADRKRRRSRTRSPSRDSSRSRSRTPRSRSRSGSSRESRSRSSSRERRSASRRKEESPTRESSAEGRKKSKKEKKQKRKKEKRSKRSRSNYSSASDGELRSDAEREKNDRDLSRNSRRSRSRSGSIASKPIVVQRDRSESPLLPVREIKADDKDIKISITLPPVNSTASMLQKTSFTLGLDGDESPKRIVRQMSPEPMAISPPREEDVKAAAVLPPPPLPPKIEEKKSNEAQFRRGRFKPIEEVSNGAESPRDATPPPPSPPRRRETSPPPKRELPPAPRRDELQLPPPALVTPPPKKDSAPLSATPKMRETKYPLSAKLLNGLKDFQSKIIASIRYEPQDEEGSGLRLSSLSTMATEESDEETKAALREQSLAALTEVQLERVELKKKQLEKQFKNDCETFKIVTMKLLNKDGELEKPIRLAMMQVVEDLEKQLLEKLDAYIESI